jgi:hypothetical protein
VLWIGAAEVWADDWDTEKPSAAFFGAAVPPDDPTPLDPVTFMPSIRLAAPGHEATVARSPLRYG